MVTLEGWFSVFTIYAQGYQWIVTCIFFTIAILICHYLFLNLTVAVMIMNLQNQKREDFENLINKKHRLYQKTLKRKQALGITNT
jgi:CHASE1-domain containing sensor protein